MGERKADVSLIQACQQGEREAFRRLYDLYKDRVYSIAVYALEGDAAGAEDVTQEVFLRLFTAIRQFRQEAEFTTWLYRMVVNACKDERRKRRHLIPLDSLPERSDHAGTAEQRDPYRQSDLRQTLDAALADLNPEMRLVVLLKYFEDLTYAEMAKILGCSPGTIASRLNRGLKILARRLAPLEGVVAPGE